MAESVSQCNPSILQQSLNDELSEQQEEWLTAHLAECSGCRSQLESLAGSRDDWSRITDALKAEQTRHASAGDADDDPITLDETSGASRFVADFAVDFLDASTDPQSIGRLDSIEIREVIGHGGNGIVLKGFQPELSRLVAAKVMAPHLAASAAARRRFAREAQATAAIVHPSVLPILSVSSSGRLPYLVMPYVDCESLQQRIDREGALPVIDVVRIALQVTRGLAAAHAQGLVHRDVKPANILLEKGVDRVMLTDFGLARAIDDASLTRSGLIAGTPQYMSPEQARGDSVDTRSDLFSLGSVLYAMCTGRPPFRAETSYGILRRVTDDEPRSIREINPEIPAWLERLVGRMLSKSPEARVSDADQLAELLEDCVAHLQQPTVNPLPPEVAQPAGPSAARRRVTLIAGTGLLLAGLLLMLAIGNRPQPEADAQQNQTQTQPQQEPPVSAPFTDTGDNVVDTAEAEALNWHSDIEQQLDELDSDTEQMLTELENEWPP